MTTALLILAAGVALACPAHMLWRMRHGRPGCGPVPTTEDDPVEALRLRQQSLARRISISQEHEPRAGADSESARH